MANTAVNYCSSDLGAKVVECCANSANAEGVLTEREDSIWSAKADGVAEKPFLTIQLPPHPAVRFIGWHVWQDYSSNPKVVEVSAGMSPNALTDVVHCTALQGPGIQLWELSTPISSAYSYIRFRVVATFGSSSTYMNRVFAFSQRPPEPSTASAVGFSGGIVANSSYSPQSRAMMMMNNNNNHTSSLSFSPRNNNNLNNVGNTSSFLNAPGAMYAGGGGGISSLSNPRGFSNSSFMLNNTQNNNNNNNNNTNEIKAFEAGSPMHMSEMLKELDDDIRLLHPLHVEGLVAKTAAAATRTSSISGRPTPTVSPANQISDQSYFNNNNNNNQNVSSSGFNSNQNQNQPPIQHSEIEELRREVAELRGRVARNSASPPNNNNNNNNNANTSSLGRSSGVGGVSFPQEELSALVDDIMQPKLMKWARKLEGRILMKVDETLKDLLGQITAAIDSRVEQHMRHVLREHHKEHGIELCHLCGPHNNNNHRHNSRNNNNNTNNIIRQDEPASSASFGNAERRKSSSKVQSTDDEDFGEKQTDEDNTNRYYNRRAVTSTSGSTSNNNNAANINRLPPSGASTTRRK